ncbi:PucR family transcriptional regulator [Ihubacter sp. rT4E-8]|uniref:PucR family transcriptional regulator n=1 Tax=Ihubacter sp. rT4E-8 TaxID=3242369 RepID=UPI003CFB6BC2
MALKVKDILQLQSLQGMKLVSGERGLERAVCSAGIADYEFASEIEYDNDMPFDKDSFIISSLLFAKNDEKKIMEAVRKLYEMGTSAFAYKDIIYGQLPQEVVKFSNDKNFPIFAFGQNVYFENIIYEIMDAVQQEDTLILAEQNILKMIEYQLPKEEVTSISKSISLFFKEYAMAVYVSPPPDGEKLDVRRILRSFYLNKGLKNKCILCRYRKGLFIILTSAFSQPEKFEVILNEAMESLSIDEEKVWVCRSNVHRSYDQLDLCLREGWHTYAASVIDGRPYEGYHQIGMFRYLIPLSGNFAMQQFADDLMTPLLDKEEFLHTCLTFVHNKGDLNATAYDCACHPNTIRYRLSKVKEMTGLESKTEAEFYAELSAAVRLYLLKEQAGL